MSVKYVVNFCSRRECEKLRKEITSQKDEERRAEMDRLSELKDEQMQAAKQGWETKLKQLLDEVSLEIQLVKMLNAQLWSKCLHCFSCLRVISCVLDIVT